MDRIYQFYAGPHEADADGVLRSIFPESLFSCINSVFIMIGTLAEARLVLVTSPLFILAAAQSPGT